jgi:hypothetical protein
MSDMSQGPGWWIASDGKWYPPHLHPSVRATETPHAESPGTAATPTGAAYSGSGAGPFVTSDPVNRFPGTPGLAYPDGTPPASETPKKHSRRPVAAAMGIVVVILLVVGGVVAFGHTQSASATVINAVNSTVSNGTAHVTLSLTGQAAGTNVDAAGTGSIDFTNNALALQVKAGVDGQQEPINEIYLGGVIYESVPGISTIAPGKSWISIDLSARQSADAQNPSTEGLGNDPDVMLKMLAQQGNTVVPLGPSTVDGVAVNGYSVTVNTASVAQQLKKANLPAWMQESVAGLKVHDLSLKVFIDNSGLLRSFETQITESTTTAGSVTVDETLGFSDYGTPVSVTAPPASEVESFQQLLQSAGSGTQIPNS